MSDRLKIAHLLATPDGKPGGLERHTLDLCAELAKRHEVHLLADPDFAPHCSPSVHFHPIHFSRSRWNPLLYIEISKTLRNIQPQLIHAQAGKSATLVARLRRFFPSTACIATQHGVQKRITPYLAMDRVITVSATLAARYPKDKVRIVHNGLALPPKLSLHERQALRRTLDPDDGRPLLIAVGRLDPIKGFDILLQAIAHLDCTLLLVGDGPAKEALQTLASELRISGRVIFAGWRNDVPQLLQAADLCVISSRSEGFPLVMIEALHAGTPLVSTDVSGVRELLPKELLVPSNDADALALLLRQSLADLVLTRTKLDSAFTLASETLTLEGMSNCTEDVYRELLSSSSRHTL
jgi:glycosyltransferase involved in cell wall biosynthesis